MTRKLFLLLLAISGLSACSHPADAPRLQEHGQAAVLAWETTDGDHPGAHRFWDTTHGGHTLLMEGVQPFAQVNLLAVGDVPGPFGVEVRHRPDGAWETVAMERPWTEHRTHVMRAVLASPAYALRVPVDDLDEVYAETLEDARFERGTAPLIPFPVTPAPPETPLHPGLRAMTLPMPSEAVTRESWGAREPNLICNAPHVPERATIHHTAGPNHDTMTAAERIRGIQSFHMDGRRWCDIGYHLLVGQDGVLYEGRRDLGRPAAHVGGENTGNIGIGMLGNFEDVHAPQSMQDTVARALAWLHLEYRIPLDRDTIKGHREYAATACPGRHFFPRLGEVVDEAKRLADAGTEPHDPTDVIEDTPPAPDIENDVPDAQSDVPDTAPEPDTSAPAPDAGPDPEDVAAPAPDATRDPQSPGADASEDTAADRPGEGAPQPSAVPVPTYSATMKASDTAGCTTAVPTSLPNAGWLFLLLGICIARRGDRFGLRST